MKQLSEVRLPHGGGRQSSFLDLRRWGPLAAGAALALFGLTRRSKAGVAIAAAGGLLAYGSVASRGGNRKRHTYHTEANFRINRSAEELFNFWRKLENLPQFMHHLKSVRVTGDRTSDWTAVGPLNAPIRWSAEIIDESPNQWIAWRSLPGSVVDTRGSVEFQRAPGRRGTIVAAYLQYRPIGGPIGKGLAALFLKDPKLTVREDLRRFKQIMEASETPTIQGQTHGPRSLKVKAIQAATSEPRKPLDMAGFTGRFGNQLSGSGKTRRA